MRLSLIYKFKGINHQNGVQGLEQNLIEEKSTEDFKNYFENKSQ